MRPLAHTITRFITLTINCKRRRTLIGRLGNITSSTCWWCSIRIIELFLYRRQCSYGLINLIKYRMHIDLRFAHFTGELLQPLLTVCVSRYVIDVIIVKQYILLRLKTDNLIYTCAPV